MSNKKSSRGTVSKTSAAASSSISTTSSKKSSILRSLFAPSEFQLALFASVIQGFESQQLRIHDINTGRLRCEYAVGAGAQINSLDWGYYGSSQQQTQKQNKKRKRQQANGVPGGHLPENAVIALGTSESDIRLFSPAEDKVIAQLNGGHDRGVKQFKFTENNYSEGWSIGADSKLVQWDLTSQRPLRTVSLPNSVVILARPAPRAPQILCASSIPYAVNLVTGISQEIDSFDAFRNPIHTLLRSGVGEDGATESFIAADSDRYMNLYDIKQNKLAKTLVCEFEVDSISTSRSTDTTSEVLAAITRNGVIQLFKAPFSTATGVNALGTTKKATKIAPSRPDATIRLVRPDKSNTQVPLLTAAFHGAEMILAWVESGLNVSFERIRWQAEDTSDLAFHGVKDVVRAKAVSALNSVTTNGVHDVGKTHVDESQAVVTAGANGVDLDDTDSEHNQGVEASADEMSSEEDSDSEAAAQQLTQEDVDEADLSEDEDADDDDDAEEEEEEDAEMADAEDAAVEGIEDGQDTEDVEPSFGEMLAAKHTEPIAIANSSIPVDQDALTSTLNKNLSIPSGLSLATVLTQSLRTNDQNLLESCFHTTDTSTVRLTIQRLDSSLAATLLQKLAERLARRPGRYGHLLVWVQWTCVAHGGAIAGRKEVLQKIQSLFRVLDQRSKSLDDLLLLKGKLDMLDAQLGLRKQMQAERHTRAGITDQNEEDIIYIEGQDESSSDDEEDTETAKSTKPIPPRKSLQELADEDAEDSDSDDEMPVTNGITSDSENETTPNKSIHHRHENLVNSEAEEASDSSPNSLLSSEEEDSDEEEDSEMNDFINDDDEISVEDDDDLLDDDTPEKPAAKKSKRK